MNGEVTEDRGIDVSITGVGELRWTLGAKQTQGTYPRTSCIIRNAIGARIEPLFHHRGPRVAVIQDVRKLSSDDTRAIVAEAREVVIVACSHREWLTAVRSPDAADRRA